MHDVAAASAPVVASASPVLSHAKQLLSQELDRLDALQVKVFNISVF